MKSSPIRPFKARRGVSFVPSIARISADEATKIPGLEAVVSHWTEGERSAGEWFEEAEESWGTSGFVKRGGGETLGFVVYGPRQLLPHAGRYPVGPLGKDTVLLAYAEGDARTMRHLLVRMFKDLRQRGFGRVEAIASDLGVPRHVSTRFLLENGWRPVRRCSRRGSLYTLARAELGSTVEVGKLVRGLIGKVRIPGFVPDTAPGVFVRMIRNRLKRFRTARSRS